MSAASPATGTSRRFLVTVVVFVGLVVAVVGSLGAPLITAVAEHYRVSLAASQWTLTIALLSGAIATPLLGRLGFGPRRRTVVLSTLAVVVAGSVLTVIPLPFAVLLIGRAAQGAGLGLTALMMATARDHLDEQRSAGTIALLSVASTAGIGIGYPLAGLLTDLAGIRAAYGLGLAVTAAALLAAETAGAMSVNQVVRSVGFSIGSALGGLILAAHTTSVFPRESGYTTAAWTGAATTAATLLIILIRPLGSGSGPFGAATTATA